MVIEYKRSLVSLKGALMLGLSLESKGGNRVGPICANLMDTSQIKLHYNKVITLKLPAKLFRQPD